MTTITSICPILVRDLGYNVQVSTTEGDLYLTTGAPFTRAEAELAAANLARNCRRHGTDAICGGLLIGLV